MKAVYIVGLIVLLSFVIVGCTQFPDANQEERQRFFLDLWEADSVESCNTLMDQIVSLGPDNHFRGASNIRTSTYPSAYYNNFMVSCVGGVAVKKNNQALCSDDNIARQVCERQIEIMYDDQGTPLVEQKFDEETIYFCMYEFEKSCLFSFISKANPQTTFEIDCNSYEGSRKRLCLRSLAIGKDDPERCLDIPDQSDLINCMHYFAFRKNDLSFCEHGKDERITECKEALEFLRNNHVTKCDGLDRFFGTSADAFCPLAFAVYNQDSSLCSRYRNHGNYINDICESFTKK
jgi:hypothetical protein